jgi:hypothetical protein
MADSRAAFAILTPIHVNNVGRHKITNNPKQRRAVQEAMFEIRKGAQQ